MFVFIIFCIIHLLLLFFIPDNVPIHLVSKILPIAIIIQQFYSKTGLDSFSKKMIFIAFLFSILGDSLLVFPKLFTFGLGSFLFAQIFFSIGFSKGANLHLIRAIPFYIMGGGIYFYLSPSLNPELSIPVLAYMFALTTMSWRASSRNIETNLLYMSIIGATSFLLSDALIALVEFKKLPIPYPQLCIMITYYLAQYLLFRSVR